MSQAAINIDTRAFVQSAAQLQNTNLPKAIGQGIKKLVTRTRDLERELVQQRFDLSTEWIPKNIRAFPTTPGQQRKIENDFRANGRFLASVSTSDRISFMSGHDDGVTRVRDNQSGSEWTRNRLAVPGPGLTGMNYRTNSGKVRSRYLPSALLKQYNGPSAPRPGKNRKLPFIIQASSGLRMIVRRKTKAPKPLSVLYYLVDRAKIQDRWDFKEKGVYWIRQYYSQDIGNAIRQHLM